MEGRSGTTAAGSTADEKKQQREVAGDVLRTEPSGAEFRRKLTTREALDMLGRSINAYRAEGRFDGGERDVPVGFGSAENKIHPDDAVGESVFWVMNKVMWKIPGFDGNTTSLRRFKMEFLMAMQLFRLDSMLAGDKEESPVADRTISRYRLHARYFKSKEVKHICCMESDSKLAENRC